MIDLGTALSRLEGVKKSGRGFIALCPAHSDTNASLSVGEGADGRLLLHCHAGCEFEDIMGKIDDSPAVKVNKPKPNAPCVVSRHEVARYKYTALDGVHEKVKIRLNMSDGTRKKHMYWDPPLRGIEPWLYNAEVLNANTGLVFITEGESDAETLRILGLSAVSGPHGAGTGKWKPEYNELFTWKTVFIIPDNDSIGYAYAEEVKAGVSRYASSVKILDLKAAYPALLEKGDITDIYEAIGADAALELIERAKALPSPDPLQHGAEPVAESKFNELVLFEQGEELPEFPLEALPLSVYEFVDCVSKAVQAPVELVATCALGVLETACRGRYPIRLSNGHVEQPCLYLAPVAAPGERKSSVMEVVSQQLYEYEAEYNLAHAVEISQSKSSLKLLQNRIESVISRASKETDVTKVEAAKKELQELHTEEAAFKTVERLELTGADVTPERLARILKSQNEVFSLVSSEGSTIWDCIGRYADKGQIDIFLKAYSGDPVRVSRMNDSVELNHPILNILAPCQPSVVEELFRDKEKVGRGLLSRISFVKCRSLVGKRTLTCEPLEDRVKDTYNNLCRDMLSGTSKGELRLDNAAFAVVNKFFNEIESRQIPEVGDITFMAEWASKATGTMIRLAGLLHCINSYMAGVDPLSSVINEDETLRAEDIARFFLGHAKPVYSEQAQPAYVNNALYLWRRISSNGSLSLTKRDLVRLVQGKRDFNLDASLTVLERSGYIRVETRQTTGRPSVSVIVNPEAMP